MARGVRLAALSVLLVLALQATPASANPAYDAKLVSDINPGTPPSNPGHMVEMGGSIFFSATTATAGEELWRTDGTAAGTTMVSDINPGAASSEPEGMTTFEGFLYFSATTPGTGAELWRSDGTAAGTTLVANINGGSASSFPGGFVELNGSLYFIAYNATTGKELWKVEPGGGVSSLSEIVGGVGDGVITGLAKLENAFVFTSSAGGNGIELWRSDGVNPASIVANIAPGGASSNPSNFTVIDGAVYFDADDGTSGIELWRSTGFGAAMVADTAPGGLSGQGSFVAEGAGTILFQSFGGAATGTELYRTNGSLGTTALVKDINPGAGYGLPVNFTPLGGVAYFSADDGLNSRELWRTDGTGPGTSLVLDLNASGAGVGFDLDRVGDTLFFPGNNGETGLELFLSDGTAAGTQVVREVTPGPGSGMIGLARPFGERLYFTAGSAATGTELWVAGLPKLSGPASLTFSNTELTHASTQSATATSSGLFDTALGALTITGPDAAAFSVSAGSCGSGLTLVPGATCDTSISFTPTATGPASATLSIAHSDAEAPLLIPLSATGVPDETPPTLTIKVKKKAPDGLVKLTASCDEACSITAKGAIAAAKQKNNRGAPASAARRGAVIKLKKAKAIGLSAGTTAKLKLRPKSKEAEKALDRLLRGTGKLEAKIKVKAIDPAGNPTSKRGRATVT